MSGASRLRTLAALLATAAALGACASGPPAAPDAPVRVMSFNVRVDVASDGLDAWPHRVEAVAATVRQADVAGVQEATAAMLDTLALRLRDFARLGTGRDADGGGEQSAILYRPDRFDRLDDGTFWLSPTPDVPGSQGWDAALPRIATWARLRDRRTGRALVVVNTHFDHVGQTARRESARLVADRALAIADGAPLVVMGDLNAPDGSDVVRTFAAVLRDTRLVSETPPSGGAATWNGFGRDPDGERIDYVFVSDGVRVLAAATLDRTIGDVLGTAATRLPSDHHAVTATVSF